MARIKRLGVLSTALFSMIYGAFIGLISGLIMAILSSVLSLQISSLSLLSGSPISIGSGWISILIFPIVYGVLGFIIGLISILIINLILKIIKGLEVEIDTKEFKSAPVQMPQQYQPNPSNNPNIRR